MTALLGQRIRSIVAASSGNLVEWFDFYIYAFATVYFAPVFFPAGDSTVQLLQAAGVFAAGFLMRPVGGWLFGQLADRRGRKHSLLVSVLLMSGGSLLIAICPGYAQIGIAAPVVLLLARLLQGLSIGGEYGTTATYMSEIALTGHRGFLSSFQYVTLIGGQLLAVLLVLVLQTVLGEEALRHGAWRIPFAVGAVAALVALFLRRGLTESTSAAVRERQGAGSLRALWREQRPALLRVLGYTAGGSLYFYAFTTYMQKYLVASAGLSVHLASLVMSAALGVYLLLQPVFGALADRIGTRNNMLIFSALGCLLPVPIFAALPTVTSAWTAFGLIVVALTVLSSYTAVSGIVKAELFPPHLRATGVGLAYALANAIFGGSAEFVALSLKKAGHEAWFALYVSAALLVCLAVSLSLPRTPPYLRDDDSGIENA